MTKRSGRSVVPGTLIGLAGVVIVGCESGPTRTLPRILAKPERHYRVGRSRLRLRAEALTPERRA